MAKSKNSVAATPAKVNKAKAIREYKTANPEAKPADIVAALAAKGIEISANYIATVNYHKNSGGKKKGTADFKEVYARLKTAGKAFRNVGGVLAAQKSLSQVKQLSVDMETSNIDELLDIANSLADLENDTEAPTVPAAE